MRRPLPRWLARRVCRLAVAPVLKADLTRLAGLLPSTE
jgi:hypothetical protein